MMDQKYIAEIEARCEAATRGPWYEEGWALPNEDGDYVELTDDSPADAAFIAHARTDLPVLLVEVEWQDQQIATLKRALELAVEDRTSNPKGIKKLVELHIQQAQEQEGKK